MGFYLVSFRQSNPPTRFFRLLECVTSFRCISLEWHVWLGRRSIYNSWSRSEKLNRHCNGRKLNPMAENSTFYPNGRNSIVCLHGPISNPQLHGRTQSSQHHGRTSTKSFFKIFQIISPSLLGMTSSTLQPHFLFGVYYDNALRASINCTN